jgi:hypothetical protein
MLVTTRTLSVLTVHCYNNTNVSSTTTTTTAFTLTFFNKSIRIHDLPAYSTMAQPKRSTAYPTHAR